MISVDGKKTNGGRNLRSFGFFFFPLLLQCRDEMWLIMCTICKKRRLQTGRLD